MICSTPQMDTAVASVGLPALGHVKFTSPRAGELKPTHWFALKLESKETGGSIWTHWLPSRSNRAVLTRSEPVQRTVTFTALPWSHQ